MKVNYFNSDSNFDYNLHPKELILTTREIYLENCILFSEDNLEKIRLWLPIFEGLLIDQNIENGELYPIIDFAKRLPNRKIISKKIKINSEINYADILEECNLALVYTDGSHFKGKKAPSFGAFIEVDGKIITLKGIITPEILKAYNIDENEKISNPTAEFIALAEVLKKLDFRNHFVIFRLDYVGVIHWLSGQWKAKKYYIERIKDFCLDKLEHINYHIEYVAAHNGEYGNEMADQLAKSVYD